MIQCHDDNFIFGRRLGTLNSARVVLLAGLALRISRVRRDAQANSHSKFSVVFNKTDVLKLASYARSDTAC